MNGVLGSDLYGSQILGIKHMSLLFNQITCSNMEYIRFQILIFMYKTKIIVIKNKSEKYTKSYRFKKPFIRIYIQDYG